MTMDPRLKGLSRSGNGIQSKNQPVSVFSNQNLINGSRLDNVNTFVDHSCRGFYYPPPDPIPSNVAAVHSGGSQEEDAQEDCEFSDVVLKYISQILMEEDMEDKNCMLQDSLDLQATEKSLYDVLGKKYPSSSEQNSTYPRQYDNNSIYASQNGDNSAYVSQNHVAPYDDFSRSVGDCVTSSSTSSGCLVDNIWAQEMGEYNSFQVQSLPGYNTSQSSSGSPNGIANTVDAPVDSPNSTLQVPDWGGGNQSIWQFRKGVEEASKFLPSGKDLFVNLDVPREPKIVASNMTVKVERREEGEFSSNSSRGRKNLHREDGDLEEEERSTKQAAVFNESPLRTEKFDEVLLCYNGQGPVAILRDALQSGTNKNFSSNGQSKGSNGGKGRGKKPSGRKDVVDLRTLLVNCAQAVAADDRRSANELLKHIRQHSSPFGDGNERLAHCFANGLEARLAGTGSQIYRGLISKRTSAADLLKAYQLFLAACPFRKMSNFAANKTIFSVSENATRLHIIDFGILYGFQWPTLIQRLSGRPGGPPKLRITGIDFPQPGFRPAERVEETGRRLANYAESFNVPFEYVAVAKKWETIQIEELKIDKDEVVVVNCLYRAKNLLDETVAADSARNMFLNLIREINPDVFLHGVINGAYNAPFFVTRFREALFHFSSLFDMLETIVPREDRERMLIEKEIFGREALNVIACEGWERVERPETYKQWQVRNLRAGFLQQPFDRDIVKRATNRVRLSYQKNFVIDQDSKWLLQGWKGRIVYALSCWKPAQRT